MNDMSATILAKSDQINAADLVGGPVTVTIREVRIKAGEDQPVSLLLKGNDKAFRPCKGVRRLLVNAWGPDANNYLGCSLTLFRDPAVTWAGKEEGGIRVSHMSHIDKEFVEWMRTSRAATKPYKIKPLAVETKTPANTADPARKWADAFLAKVAAATSVADLSNFVASKNDKLAELAEKKPDLHAECVGAAVRRETELADAAAQSETPADDAALIAAAPE
jgi:hypothetical protein